MPLAANALALVRDLASRLSDLITDSVDSLPAPIHTAATDLGVSTATLVAATATTTLLATTALAASRRHRSRRQARTYSGPAPPHVKHLVPFFGSMVAFGMDPIGFLQRNQQELGDVFTFTMFGREMTFALGPDGNHLVFNAKLTQASAEQAYNSLTKPVFGEKVVYDTDNHRFMDQKKFGKTGMSNENLRAYVPMIEAETRDYLARWTSASDSKELFTALSELTIMTASRCLMGPEVRSRLDDSVAKLYHDLDQGFQPVNFLFEWLPLPSYWRRDRAHVKMRNLFLGIMRQRRASGMDKEEYTDVLQVFMNAKYRSGDQFTELEAAHMMIALLMAGQHTSSTTGTWALSFLADHPDVWKAVEDELARELGGDLLAGELTYDVLKRCELLDSVVRETLRLRPPITSIMRKVIAPIEFKGYVIPPGHYICAAPAVSHLDGAAFEDAEQFKPTRWMSTTAAKGTDEEEAQGKDAQDFGFGLVGGSARSHYLPFGAGRHRCIGEQFAYVQLKTIIASVVRELRSLRFEGKNKFPARDFTSMIVMPERPVMVSYERRVPPKKRVPERTGSSTSLVGEDGINKQQRQGSAMAAETY